MTGPDPQALDAAVNALPRIDYDVKHGTTREIVRRAITAYLDALPAEQRPTPGLVEAARVALGRGRGLLAVVHGEFCVTADVGRCEDCAVDARTFDRLDAALPPKETPDA